MIKSPVVIALFHLYEVKNRLSYLDSQESRLWLSLGQVVAGSGSEGPVMLFLVLGAQLEKTYQIVHYNICTFLSVYHTSIKTKIYVWPFIF